MKFKAYHKIKQFKDVVRDISFKANFKGLDENGKPIYEESTKPTLTFTATTKLHGTNSGICYTPEKGVFAQKRSSLLRHEDLNAHFGFNQFVLLEKKEFFEETLKQLFRKYCSKGEQITLYGEWAGCFSYDTPILLSDGSTRNIGQIVKNKETVEVLSYNKNTYKLESKKIVNWFNNGETNDWLKIGYKRRKRGGRKPYLKVTKNHKIFKKENSKIIEVSAGELKTGDIVFTNGNTVSTNQLDFIKGSLMGDASISDIKHFQVSHSENNQPYYNNFIKKLFKNISSHTSKVSGHGSNMKGIFSVALNEVEDIYYETYLQGNKKPNIDFLNKLNPKSLAVWYMDDGTLSNHSGENRQNQAELMTMGWDLVTNENICKWLKSRGYDNYICKDNSYEEVKYFIRFTPKGTVRFLSDINFYMLKEFDYKLPKYLHNKIKFDWFETYGEYEKGLVETRIESIRAYTPIENYKKVKYDIEVEDNHNYFANRILVHNSGVQKSVGISELNKGFYIFDCKVYNPYTDTQTWLDISTWKFRTDKVFNINDFQTWSLDIDFNIPGMSQNKLVEITEEIERECPVSKQLGVENSIGEGAVWTCFYKGDKFIFKVKGDAHAGKSKVKQLKPVDNEKLQKINETVDKLTPIWRLNQILTDVFRLNEGEFLERKKIGEYIKSVIKDIIEEENLTIKESGLEFKELTKGISIICKNYFFEQESTF